jgi:hypothetical protein
LIRRRDSDRRRRSRMIGAKATTITRTTSNYSKR